MTFGEHKSSLTDSVPCGGCIVCDCGNGFGDCVVREGCECDYDGGITAHHHYGGNASQAAEALEITRRYLGKLLEKHSIDLQSLKRRPPAGARKTTR